ncbi:MAG TPA: mRNA surveillance protein pelota [Candidatus Bathyarchaeota archaeon]|nr:mRNA surveillance protein pelota [Candidatus Bathyarchaeota archaeon]
MKVEEYKEFVKKWREGKKRLSLRLTPESEEDLWHLYNLIEAGDLVHARTSRTVKTNEAYSRPKKGRRVSLDLTVEVEKVAWDRFSNKLRVHGVVREAPEEFNVVGFHHTLSLAVNKPFTLTKERWRKHHVDRLELAMKARVQPVVVVSIDDEDLCIAVVREFGIDVKVEERVNLPGKLEAEYREKAKNELFKRASETLEKVTREVGGKVVVIGPGFIKNEFVEFVKKRYVKLAEEIVDVKGVNSAGVSGIHEALRSGVLSKAFSKIRLSVEMNAIREVLKRLGKGRGDITYGIDDVERAAESGAVDRLLVLDSYFREASEDLRLRLEKIMGYVEDRGGKVLMVSARNEAGLQLKSLGGIAAILRYPIA